MLAYVRFADHGFNARSAALHEADALRWLGHDGEAATIITRLANGGLDDGRVVARLRDWGLAGESGGEFAHRLREIEKGKARIR